MSAPFDVAWVSPNRFSEYLDAAGGNSSDGLALYEWNAEVSAALFEVIHHVEVLLRNKIVEVLASEGVGDAIPGTPWIQNADKVLEVAARLARDGDEVTASRVHAGLTFGFWQRLFSKEYDSLWEDSLRFVFKSSRADRGVIAAFLESINQLRNRIAHHGSMLELDTSIELKKLLRLAYWIDPDASAWISGLEKASAVSGRRPVAAVRNVLVVPANDTWSMYERRGIHAYVCPPGRSFQPVEYIAYYADQEVKSSVAKIVQHFEAVDFNKVNSRRLLKSSDISEAALGKVIAAYTAHMGFAGVYQVFLVTGPRDEATVKLSAAIEHGRRGAGSAFTQRHRYFALAQIKSARSTDDLS